MAKKDNKVVSLKENKIELTELQQAQVLHSDAVFQVAVAEAMAQPYMENLERARQNARDALMQVNELKRQEAEPNTVEGE